MARAVVVLTVTFAISVLFAGVYFVLNYDAPVIVFQPSTSFTDLSRKQLIINEASLDVLFASTPDARNRGLSVVDALKENEGMWFVFDTEETHGFWMKDMKFSIDIIWVNAEMKVVHIEKNIAPETFPQVYESEVPARYVLELGAGRAEQIGIKVGDFVTQQ